MKRFLSIMLTVMLVLSSFVMVSASEELSGVITVNGTYDYSLGTYEGYYKISADIYVTADVTSASISAVGDETVATKGITSSNAWQTVEVNVLGDSFNKVNFTAEGGTMYVKAVRVAQIYKQNLVYTEDFTGETVGANVEYDGWLSRYATEDGNKSPVGEEEKTTFTVASDIGGSDEVGYIYKPTAAISGTSDSSGGAFEYINGKQKQDNYYIDIPEVGDADHIRIEFDAYNPGHRRNDGNPVDTLDFAVVRDNATVVWANQAPRVEITRNTIQMINDSAKVSHSAGTLKWNKVVYEAKRYQNADNQWCVDYSVTYGGKTASKTIENAWTDNFKRLLFGVNYNYGGGFYIDNIKVYTLDEEIENVYYTEDFTGETAGAEVSYTGWKDRYENNEATSTKPPIAEGEETTFTVASNIGGSETVAHIYKPTAAKSGTSDSSGGTFKIITGQKQDNFYIDIPEVGDADHIRLEFDAYNPGYRRNSGNSVDTLDFAVARDTSDVVWANQVPRAELSVSDIKTVSNTESNHSAGTLAWNKVVYEAKRYQNDDDKWCVDYSVTYGGKTVSQTLEGAYADNFKRLLFGVNYNYGGGFYIDNIKVSSPITTDAQLEALDTYAKEVYAAEAKVEEITDAYKVLDGTFSKDAQSITLVKAPGAADTIQVVTAIFEGGVLKDAKVNANIDTSAYTAFNNFDLSLAEKVNVPETLNGETFKVFVFDTAESLKPLANMISGAVTATETPAE